MNWGKWIIVAFIAFAGFIATLVTICVRQDISLVSKEYYKDELNYSQQIQRLENTNRLATKPEISIVDRVLVINYDELPKMTSGNVKLFRPSNSKLDRSFELLASPSQSIDVHSLPVGMYKVQMAWKIGDTEYFIEKIVHL